MTNRCDFRDLLAKSVTLGARVWGLPESLLPLDTVKEASRLGDESTFLHAVGISPDQNRKRLLQLCSFLDSNEAADALSYEGERWRIGSIVTTVNETLQEIGNKLAEDLTMVQAGKLLRALPVMAGSKFTTLGNRLAQVLGTNPGPEALVAAYGDAFCRGDEKVLAAVDRMILDDEVIGLVAVELAARLMRQLGYDGTHLSRESREALINCLALLIGEMTGKTSLPGAITNGQNDKEGKI